MIKKLRTIASITAVIALFATGPVVAQVWSQAANAQSPGAYEGVKPSRAGLPADKCPQGSNTQAYTTITYAGRSVTLAACSWEYVCKGDYDIPIGDKYTITTKVPTPIVFIVKTEKPGVWAGYTYDKANIQGSPPIGKGGCNGSGKEASCEATMEPSGAKVLVNYHWGRYTDGCALMVWPITC